MLIHILNYFMKSGLPAESGRIAISNPKLVLRRQPRSGLPAESGRIAISNPKLVLRRQPRSGLLAKSGTVKVLNLAVLTCLMRITNL